MGAKTKDIVEEYIKVSSRIKYLAGVVIDHDESITSMMNVKFRTHGRIEIKQILISSSVIDEVIKSNFTSLERMYYGMNLPILAIETILLFSYNMIEHRNSNLYDTMMELGNMYTGSNREEMFHYVKHLILPDAEIQNDVFPSSIFDNYNISQKRRNRLIPIFSMVIMDDLEEVLGVHNIISRRLGI